MKFRVLVLLVLIVSSGMLIAQPFSLTSTRSYLGSNASGQYQIYRSSVNHSITLNNLRKPLIFVEGFDPDNSFGFGTSGNIYSMINSIATNNLASSIHTRGYDIIILNFNDGGDYIQRNALLLVELIELVNSNKPGTDPVVIMGYSMGGLVARYALNYMEENNIDHEVQLFISIDSPHKGAHVPAGIQAMAKMFDSPAYLTMFPDLASSLSQLNAPAARQMLKYRLSSSSVLSGELPLNFEFVSFFSELDGMNGCNGFPSKCRNVAVSLGSWNGVGQRSELDLDNNGIRDLQHSAFPIIEINIPKGSRDELWIVDMNECEIMASVLFQMFISTCASSAYPDFSNRYSYSGLGNDSYATFWYLNTELFPFIFPGGGSSRLWWYKDEEPLDFAPGGFMPLYDDITSALGGFIDCYAGYAKNSTFVPTISALAFDTDNAFYNIASDANKLKKTPFDNIIGITGDNTSHMINTSFYSQVYPIVNFILDEISNDYGGTCAYDTKTLSGTVNNGQNIAVRSAVKVYNNSSYNVQTGANVGLFASQSIVFEPGLLVNNGAILAAEIRPCAEKACHWQSEDYNNFSSRLATGSDTTHITYNREYPEVLPMNEAVCEKITPNPNNGSFSIDMIGKARYEIINSLGNTVDMGTLYSGNNRIFFAGNTGVYTFITYDQENKVIGKEKFIKY